MVKQLGAWGRTLFALKPSTGLDGDRLVLRSRDGAIELGCLEIRVIVALASAWGITPDSDLLKIIKDRLTDDTRRIPKG